MHILFYPFYCMQINILPYLTLPYLTLPYLTLPYCNIASDGHLPTENTDHLRTVLRTLLKKSSNIGVYGQYRTLRMCAFVWTEFTLIFLDP